VAERLRRAWAEHSSPELAEVVSRDPVAVLPVASVEQHGPHLPLSTDLDIGLGLLERALASLEPDFPVLTLPPQAVGSSPEHARWAGTLTLDPDLLADTVRSIGEGVARAGVRRLLIADSHGGNRGAIEAAALRLRAERGLLVAKAHWARFRRPEGLPLSEAEWRHGWHGGAVETAMMLHLRPGSVRREALPSGPSLGEELAGTLRRLAPEGEASFAWLAGDLPPSGTTGDPRPASPELAAALVAHYAAALAETIRDARAFPLERLR